MLQVVRHSGSGAEKQERKGAIRSIKTKQIDVNEAMALSSAAVEQAAAETKDSRKRKEPADAARSGSSLHANSSELYLCPADLQQLQNSF